MRVVIMIRINASNILTITLLIFMAFSGGCEKVPPCGVDELYKTVSYDKSLEATVSLKDCGATTGKAYNVHVTQVYAKESKEELIFVADKVKGMNVLWEKDNLLVLEFKSARVFKPEEGEINIEYIKNNYKFILKRKL